MRYIPNWYHWIIGIVTIVLSLVSCNCGHYSIVSKDIFSILIYGLAIPFLLSYVKKNKNNYPSLTILGIILGLVFSIIIAIGKNYSQNYEWDSCFGSLNSVILIIVQASLYFYILYKIVLFILIFFENYSFNGKQNQVNTKKLFWLIIAVKCLFFIAFFPCLFDFDAALGLRTFLDHNSAICDHHPITVEAIHALFFTVGQKMGSTTVGFVILSLIFVFVTTLIIIYGIKLVGQSNISPKCLSFVIKTFALFPFYPYISLLPTKDGFFTYAVLLYIFSFYDIYITNTKCLESKKYLVIHSLAALFVCLTRHQGLSIVIVCSITLYIYYRKHRNIIFKSSSFAILTTLLFKITVFQFFDIEPGGKQEILGSLFQQTALYLKQYPEDVTEKEDIAIKAILKRDIIITDYKDNITDPVKSTYKYNPRFSEKKDSPRKFRHIDHSQENKDLKNYISAWCSMGIKHPITYLQASSSISLGFFYNCQKALINIYTEGYYHPVANTKEYQFWKNECISRIYDKYRKNLTKIPILNWFCAIPYYIWAAILMIGLLVFRRDVQGIIIFLPIILSIGILVLCPVVNGRYAFPIVVALPLLFVYLLSSKRK